MLSCPTQYASIGSVETIARSLGAMSADVEEMQPLVGLKELGQCMKRMMDESYTVSAS